MLHQTFSVVLQKIEQNQYLSLINLHLSINMTCTIHCSTIFKEQLILEQI